MLTLQEFVQKYTGTNQDFDGGYGSQCVDYARLYAEQVWGIKTNVVYPPSPADGGAKHAFTDYPRSFINGRGDLVERISNTSTNCPQAGDIIIWNEKKGNSWGHIAIVINADVNRFRVSEQNTGNGDGFGSDDAIRYNNYDYKDVLGWLRLRQNKSEPTKSGVVDLSNLNEQEKAMINLNNKEAIANTLRDRNHEIVTLKNKVLNLESENRTKNQKIFELENGLGNVQEIQFGATRNISNQTMSQKPLKMQEVRQSFSQDSVKNQLSTLEAFVKNQLPTIATFLASYNIIVQHDQLTTLTTGAFAFLSYILSLFLASIYVTT